MADKPKKRRRTKPGAGDDAEQPSSKAAKKTGQRKHALTSLAAQQASQLLRVLDRTDRQFWKGNMIEQLSQQATDRNSRRSEKRSLPKHEITTLALNEVAAKHGRGMFLYLPSREVWKTVAGEILAPACRDPMPPGSQYPSIVFADCVWNQASTRDFYQNTHRSRYLKANATFCTLPKSTPLYAIQYVHHANFQLFATSQESLIVFATADSFFLATTNSISPKQGRVRGGVEPEKRLEVPRMLWTEGDIEGTLEHVTSLELLYQRILGECVQGRIGPTFSMEELTAIVPRPTSPGEALAVSLGTPFPGEHEVRTEPLRKRKAKKAGASGSKEMQLEGMDTDEQDEGEDTSS